MEKSVFKLLDDVKNLTGELCDRDRGVNRKQFSASLCLCWGVWRHLLLWAEMLFPNVTQGGHPLYCTPNKAVCMHVCVHVPSVSFCVLFTSLMALYRLVSHDIDSFVGNRQQNGLYWNFSGQTKRWGLEGEEIRSPQLNQHLLKVKCEKVTGPAWTLSVHWFVSSWQWVKSAAGGFLTVDVGLRECGLKSIKDHSVSPTGHCWTLNISCLCYWLHHQVASIKTVKRFRQHDVHPGTTGARTHHRTHETKAHTIYSFVCRLWNYAVFSLSAFHKVLCWEW